MQAIRADVTCETLSAMATGTLILMRHGESTWNESNQFTGWVDVALTDKGRAEAKRAGELLVEHDLLPAVRQAPPGAVVLADGFSCRTQVDQLADRDGVHLAQLLADNRT